MGKHLSTDPYKGVRDFYPDELRFRRWMFKTLRDVVARYGYEEYDASILEPTELYLAKSSKEIVDEQTYTFADRGDRSVTLRPEMTPTVARMVAARRRDLTFPLRWFSLPTLFRYERPQRGRLREHVQLNVDLFGVKGIEAEIEIITIACDLLRAFGTSDSDFEIRINHRCLLTGFFQDALSLKDDIASDLMRLIDRRDKMEKKDFEEKLEEYVGEKSADVLRFLDAQTLDEALAVIPQRLADSVGVTQTREVIAELEQSDISVRFSPSLVRGFDYYTGIVFEVFDTDPENNRSILGGGRFDGLTELFGEEPVAAVGFALGDVTLQNFLESRDIEPELPPAVDLYICTTEEAFLPEARAQARALRENGANVAVDLSGKSVGDQIRIADKKHIPHVLCIGEQEKESKRYTVKTLATGDEKELSENEIKDFILGARKD